MKLSVEINMDNAAFVENHFETANILLRVIEALRDDTLEPGGISLTLFDSNGDHVGTAQIDDGEED